MKKVLMSVVMMGMAGVTYAAEFGDLAVKAADLKALAGISKGYVEPVEPATPIEWVSISGGKFTMGTTSIEQGVEDTKPVREVSIKTFAMSKTDVTVAQYAECVIKGACTKPATTDYCNWGKPGRGNHPVNCVDWNQAKQYAKFKGARLPSEAEWEYAATSGGRNQKYPWGNDEPTSELAVFNTYSTMPVCSKPKGNTAQGLCDMAGNVWQWVQDTYQNSYAGAVDGSAFEGSGSYRVIRGGSFRGNFARNLRADYRFGGVPGYRYFIIGFRLAR
jgi:formylglycine-generating enzyme required for sulfatase activity